MSELLDIQLDEAFDSVEGYNVVNMKPGSSAPQIFLIQNDADNLIVRMMALSGDGDKVRVLKETDKNVIVELMSINETGRHIVLKSGIGSNPMKTIVTIFDTVVQNLNLNMVDTIMFRFQPKKMGAQAKSIQRIVERLAMTRGKGKFVSLKEMENFTGKFSYVVLHKKRIDLEKLPGAKKVSDKYKKVETAVGEVFVDEKSGEQVSKAEVVANAIADSVNKITPQELVQKTKISKKELMNAMYSHSAYKTERMKSDRLKGFKYDDKEVVFAAPENESAIGRRMSKMSGSNQPEVVVDLVKKSIRKAVENNFDFDVGSDKNEAITSELTNTMFEIADKANPLDLQTSLVELAEVVSSTKFAGIEYAKQVKMMKEITSVFLNDIFFSKLTDEYLDEDANDENTDDFEKNEISAIEKYTDFYYKEVNEFLTGKKEILSNECEKIIDGLDSAFEKGQKLPKGTVLYRGYQMPLFQYAAMIKMKAIYFKNFVSTSLFPVIYGSLTDATGSLIPGGEVIDDMDSLQNSKTISQDAIPHLTSGNYPSNVNRESVNMSMVIKKADQIKVLIPGRLSAHQYELEVILPRGIALKVNKITGTSKEGRSYNTFLLDTEVMNPSELNECNEFIDGDHLMETGEVKTIRFGSMYEKMHLNEAVIPDSERATDLLLSCIDFDEIPDRFK